LVFARLASCLIGLKIMFRAAAACLLAVLGSASCAQQSGPVAWSDGVCSGAAGLSFVQRVFGCDDTRAFREQGEAFARHWKNDEENAARQREAQANEVGSRTDPRATVTTPVLADPNALADYAGHTNQDYETAERICGEKGTLCRNDEADKLRDARRAREPARKPPCEGITADDVRDIETRFPRTMNGVPAMPVAVSNPYVSSVNGEPTCAAEMIVTFGGDVGYNYVFLIEQRPDRLHLEPVYGAGLRNPPPIRLYH
jgi:hypothetical protein